MSNQTPDRIKATLTIELDFAKEDQLLIGGVLEHIIEALSFSQSGNGKPTPNSHYSYRLKSNLPCEPMTLGDLFEMMDAELKPGEPTTAERFFESMHPDTSKP